MNITLINATRRMKVVNLPHEVYCEALGRCACGHGPGGRKLAASLTLPAGGATSDLDEAVLLAPDVARDVKAGELRVRRDAPAPKPKTKSRKAPRRTGRKKTR